MKPENIDPQVISWLNQRSLENFVLYNKETFEYLQKNKAYPEWSTYHDKRNLRDRGLVKVRKEKNGNKVLLTDKALKVIESLEKTN